MRHLGWIAQRLFGNNIDGSRNRRRAEQGRTTTAHHFHPFDHIGRNLFQSIHAGQCAEDRTAVYQYLRIRSVQTVDTHLLETTVLAVILDPHARLEIQSFGQRHRIGRFKHFRIQDIHQRRSHPACCLITVGRNDNAIQRNSIFFRLKIHLQGFPFLENHLLLDRLIPDRFQHQLKFSFRQIGQRVMTGSIGNRSDRCSFQENIHIRDMLSWFFIYNMSEDIGIRRIQIHSLVFSSGSKQDTAQTEPY